MPVTTAARHVIDTRDVIEGADAELLAVLAAAADPDLALGAIAAIAERCGPVGGAELRTALRGERGFRDRLTAVLGASPALGDYLLRHPDDWRILRGPDALRRPSAGELRAGLLNAVCAWHTGDGCCTWLHVT